jgi:hypothetical protein
MVVETWASTIQRMPPEYVAWKRAGRTKTRCICEFLRALYDFTKYSIAKSHSNRLAFA